MRHFNFIKGIIIGIAKIIPGLSGSVLMLSFNLYDKAISAITNFFDDVKNNFFFLLELCLGILVGIVLFSKILVFLLKNYYLYTMSFFIGLIFGGVPIVFKNFSRNKLNIMISFLSFGFVTLLSIIPFHYTYSVHYTFSDFIIFFFAGILEAVGTVVPGISSTALLMLIGIYSYYITSISHLFSFSFILENLFFFIPFSLGILVGIVVVSWIIHYLFQHYREQTFAAILGFSLSSIFFLIDKLVPFLSGGFSVLFCLFLIICGYFITSKL